MSTCFKTAGVIVALAMLVAVPLPFAPAQESSSPSTRGNRLFSSLKAIPIHITLTAGEFEVMQPSGGGGFPGFGQPPAPPKKPADGREVERNEFGIDLPWAVGSVAIGGERFDKVGLRYKGNGTILETMRVTKKSIKLDLDRHQSKQDFDGITTINLHSGVTDPSKARETLGYAAYRAAGVPAPRTGLAEVTLTVPGKFDREYLGLFTIVEAIDKPFLKHHYKIDKGLLMKPERVGGLNYLGENWEQYTTTYQPKRDATRAEQKRVIDFTRFVNQSTDEAFAKEIGSYLDVDAFLRFMAVTVLEANMDSFFTLGHNYCLYLHPDTNKFHFIPWDLDRSFANFGVFGTPEQIMDLSITRPAAQCRLVDRLLAIRENGEFYRRIVKDIAATSFSRDRLLEQLEAFNAATKEIRALDAKAAEARGEAGSGPPGQGFFGRVPEMREFIDKRTESVAAQLAKTSKGYEPQPFGFGPPGGFGPGNQLARPLLEAADANRDGRLSEAEMAAGMKRLFGEWDIDRNGALDQKELADGLQKLAPAPKGFGGFGGPPKGGFGGPPKGAFPPGKPPESPLPRPQAP